MYVFKIQNQPNFQMTYVNKQSWNKNILKTLEKSNLVKEIDRKYPTAFASYTKIMEEDLANADPNYHISFILKLAKDKVWNVNLDSHTSEGVENFLVRILKQKTLQDIEKESKPFIENLRDTISIKPKKENLFSRFFRSIFL